MIRQTTLMAAALAAATLTVAPLAASAATTAACTTVTKAHAVKTVSKKIVRKTVKRPVAVAAYRETAPASETRTVVETRYVYARPRVVVEAAPAYYEPYPVYYGGYGYGRPIYHHYYYGRPIGGYHRHW